MLNRKIDNKNKAYKKGIDRSNRLIYCFLNCMAVIALTACQIKQEENMPDKNKQNKSSSELRAIPEIVYNKMEDGTTRFHCRTGESEPGKQYTVYQLSLTDEAGGCCYAIKMPDGRLIMIDSGYQSDALYVQNFILEHGGKVDSWFITHPHFDHVGGLISIIRNQKNSNITIDKIYYAPFTEEFFHTEESGKDLKVLNNALLFKEFESLRQVSDSTQYIPMANGDEVIIEDVMITCMNGFDPLRFDVNTNSLVLHFDIKGIKLLFTGDITDQSIQDMCEYWKKDSPLWKVDFLQIPHHGYIAGITNDAFYRLTRPGAAFLDCSESEYETNAVQIKEHMLWLDNLNIPVVRRYQGINEVVID